jgi:adenylate cyclase
VVISWKLEKGVKNTNCLRCFQLVRDFVSVKGLKYQEKYGIRPSFKAGVHYGKVTAGEIGSIKKDIVYSGDVLNTASRIQEQCNEYDVDFLISGETLDLLSVIHSYEPVNLGEIELRGKQNKIELYTLKVA